MTISEEAVRLRSYFIWQREGCPEGRQAEHWQRARDELAAEQARALAQVSRFDSAIMPRVRISRRPSRVTAERGDRAA